MKRHCTGVLSGAHRTQVVQLFACLLASAPCTPVLWQFDALTAQRVVTYKVGGAVLQLAQPGLAVPSLGEGTRWRSSETSHTSHGCVTHNEALGQRPARTITSELANAPNKESTPP